MRDEGPASTLADGIALCLSGGGYRAMLFHVGAIWRLNELGFLPRLDRISSVSGGSIAAATLGLFWKDLRFDAAGVAGNLREVFVDRVRRLAARTIDRPAILRGALLPGGAGERIAAAYEKHLFGDATLQDLPERPRLVINATSVQSGVLWRFCRPYMADYRVGVIPNPALSLALAVAASSAFPPVLSPVEIELDPDAFTPQSGTDLQRAPYTSTAVLTDGGVYDNLGLETAYKRYRTLLVSDGGGAMAPDPDPETGAMRHTARVLDIIDNQVRSLRKRQLIGAFRAGVRNGAYWGIRSDIADYGLGDAIAVPHETSLELAGTPTRLKAMEDGLQERLIDWGYAVCDAAMRRWVVEGVAGKLPYKTVK